MFWLISRRSQSSVSLSTSSPSLLPSVPLLSHSIYTHSLIVGCSHSVLKVEVGQHLCLVIGLLVIRLFVWLFCSLCVCFGEKRERWLVKSNVANFCHPLCMYDGFRGLMVPLISDVSSLTVICRHFLKMIIIIIMIISFFYFNVDFLYSYKY